MLMKTDLFTVHLKAHPVYDFDPLNVGLDAIVP